MRSITQMTQTTLYALLCAGVIAVGASGAAIAGNGTSSGMSQGDMGHNPNQATENRMSGERLQHSNSGMMNGDADRSMSTNGGMMSDDSMPHDNMTEDRMSGERLQHSNSGMRQNDSDYGMSNNGMSGGSTMSHDGMSGNGRTNDRMGADDLNAQDDSSR